MIFTQTTLAGACIIDLKKIEDERGFFAYLFCAKQAAEHGIATNVAQVKLSSNKRKGTLRGMHLQVPPAAEQKLVRCIRGAIFDVAVDLRPDSPTFRNWVGAELTAANRRAMYLPPGVAHGYQTLTDSTEVMYFVSAAYSPSHARGVRWNDPAFGIEWPLGAPVVIHERDAGYPDFEV